MSRRQSAPPQPQAAAPPCPDPLDALLERALDRTTDPALRGWLEKLRGGERAEGGGREAREEPPARQSAG
jgi:hypothetical protein